MPQKLIVVRSAHEDARVALWERDPRHAAREVFVYRRTDEDADPANHFTVYPTPGVLQALAEQNGGLVEVDVEPEVEAGPDLTDIDGIGETRANMLREDLEVLTVEQIAGADEEQRAIIANRLGTNESTVAGWVENAKALLEESE